MEVDKIYNQLLKIGFSKKRVGTLYIAESVVYIYENNLPPFLERGIYQYLAQKHQKKKFTIKSNMISCCLYASKTAGRSITAKFIIRYLIYYNSKKLL